jgi:predicted transcriptional regulator
MDAQVSGQEIIEEYGKVKKKIAKLGQEKLNIAIEKVSDYVTKNLTTLDDNQGANLRDFMKHLPAELRVSAWSKLTAAGVEKLDLAKSVHKWCVDSILEVFGAAKGEAGVGVVPGAEEKKTTKRAKK